MSEPEYQAKQDTEITGITCDSRKVEPGYLFVALPGTRTDGRQYIDDAVAKGAAAVLAPEGTRFDGLDPSIPVLTDAEPRKRYAKLAAKFFALQPQCVVAVTGTNGKTSVADFARQLWSSLGQKAGSLGTVGLNAPGFDAGESLTTPDAADLHRMLFDLTKAGVEHLAIEASSHGLSQYRLDGIRLRAAAFTNLSRDHLDYHGDMESYFRAKARLFTEVLSDDGVAVLNADSDHYPALLEIANGRDLAVIDYGKQAETSRVLDIAPTSTGQVLSLRYAGADFQVQLPLVGAFQAENALAALGLFLATGGAIEAGMDALGQLQGAPGRMDYIGATQTGGQVYVDYAHTPDALETALKALRPHCANKLHVVFGCGGDRDQGKRPEMGRAAVTFADRVIVTDDNPRSEDAADIRKQILDAATSAVEVADRASAITQAIAGLVEGDALIIAGKGHETGQIVGDQVLPFDDRVLARALIGGGA